MIKLGIMARETREASLEDTIAFAYEELKLDTIDLHLSGVPRETAYLTKIKMLCHRHGLCIGYLGGGSLAGPEAELRKMVEQAKEDVDLTAFMGAELLRLFARHKWPDTVEEQEALWGPMIRSFQEVSDYAAGRGVVVGVQNHDESSFAMTADQVLRILRETNRDNFTFIMDTGQWRGAIGSDPRGQFDPNVDLYKDYLERTAPYATCVRAKIYKIDSGREEFLDYGRIMKILKAVNFNGIMSIVFEGGDRNTCDRQECLRLAVRHLREVMAATYGD
jgi:sugar phosphate isomerase/epimerase